MTNLTVQPASWLAGATYVFQLNDLTTFTCKSGSECRNTIFSAPQQSADSPILFHRLSVGFSLLCSVFLLFLHVFTHSGRLTTAGYLLLHHNSPVNLLPVVREEETLWTMDMANPDGEPSSGSSGVFYSSHR